MLASSFYRRRCSGQMPTAKWQPVVKKLQEKLPQLVVHGIYDPEKSTQYLRSG